MIEMIVSSSVLILVITALRFCLRGRIFARLQYALWMLVVLRLLLPISLFESPVSVMNLMPETAVIESQAVLAAKPAEDTAALPVEQPAAPVIAGGDRGADWKQIAVGVWLGGAALCTLTFLTANLRMSRRLRRCRVPVECPDCKVAVYTASGLPSPCLYGLWKPAVYLTPESMADATRLSHILAHEETHYRHRDHLWALLRAVCVCLHWYHPLVWLAASLSRQDGELACDEATLMRLGDQCRAAYGKTLIEMMVSPTGSADLFCCATTMRSGKGELAQRLRRIAKRPKMLVTAALLTLLVSMIAVAATFGEAQKPVERPANLPLAEQLWNARTEYVGNAPAIGKLIGLLPVVQGLQYDHFQLHTDQLPYSIEIVYTATDEVFARYDQDERNELASPFQRNALVLLALVDNADGVRATIQNGKRTIHYVSLRSWAEETVGGDLRGFAKTPEQVASLLEYPLTSTPDSDDDSFQPTASYHVTRFGKNGEVISVAALTDEALAKSIVMDFLVKSSAWPGVDVNTLEEYYLIEQTFAATGEAHEYYAYLLPDGKAVLQSGNNGMYTRLSQELYVQLDDIYTNAVERQDAAAQ